MSPRGARRPRASPTPRPLWAALLAVTGAEGGRLLAAAPGANDRRRPPPGVVGQEPLPACNLETVNSQLRTVWQAVDYAGKSVRSPTSPPSAAELSSHCVRQLFLSLEDMGDKTLRALEARSFSFSWTTQWCRQVDRARGDIQALSGVSGSADPEPCGAWPELARSLNISRLASCMDSVAAEWWKGAAYNLDTVCKEDVGAPAALGYLAPHALKAMADVVPHLAFPASRLLPRLKPCLDRIVRKCVFAEAHIVKVTNLQALMCHILMRVAAEHSDMEERGKLPKSELGDVPGLPDAQEIIDRAEALALKVAGGRRPLLWPSRPMVAVTVRPDAAAGGFKQGPPCASSGAGGARASGPRVVADEEETGRRPRKAPRIGGCDFWALAWNASGGGAAVGPDAGVAANAAAQIGIDLDDLQMMPASGS